MIELTAPALRQIWPKAPQAVNVAFVDKQDLLTKAGVNHTRTRLAYFMANLEHECGGFTIKNLTENVNYTAARAVQVWPSRFKSTADVYAKIGSFEGDRDFKRKLMNSVYGGRMGNRPGTDDGYLFIGHGGPQWTGRGGHEALARILKQLVPELGDLTAEQAIEYAIDHSRQPEVCVAFWMWKNLNRFADTGDFKGCVKAWNGGQIGLADRQHLMAGNDHIIARLRNVERIAPIAKELPGSPPTALPPKEVVDEATKNERKARSGGAAIGGAGGVNEGAKTKAVTEKPADLPLLSTPVAMGLVSVGVVVFVVAAVLIARKKAAIVANWF